MLIFSTYAHYCRALPGLSLLLALPKSKQKASASSLGDPQPVCRLKGTNGLSPRPFLRRLHRVGSPACGTNAREADARQEPALSGFSCAVSFKYGAPIGRRRR
ncbi:hypothetical protein [Dysgonomonas reticulitermitis]